MKIMCVRILMIMSLLGCFVSKAESLFAITESIDSGVRTLVEVKMDINCCLRYDLPTSNMYLVADSKNEDVYLVNGMDCGVQLFELNENRDLVLKYEYSKIENAFGYYNGWLYGTTNGRLVRQKENEYQELCFAPNNYEWRSGRSFKPAISCDGKVAYIKLTENGVVLCTVDPDGVDPEPGTLRFRLGMVGEYQEIALCENREPNKLVSRDIVWSDSRNVMYFKQNDAKNGQLYYEIIAIDTTDGRIAPVKLREGGTLFLDNCTLVGLSAFSGFSNDIYVSVGVPYDPMWYMHNEVGVPFDIYRFSCDTGEKSVVLELDYDEYLIEESRIVVQ